MFIRAWVLGIWRYQGVVWEGRGGLWMCSHTGSGYLRVPFSLLSLGLQDFQRGDYRRSDGSGDVGAMFGSLVVVEISEMGAGGGTG